MFEILNETPFLVMLVPTLDKTRVEHMTAVIKGTFRMVPGTAPLPVHDQQLPVVLADQPAGEPPERASLLRSAEVGPAKLATDVAVVGHAYPRGGSSVAVEASIQVGPVSKVIRVAGDRVWQKAGGRWVSSRPAPFERMPLVYERAFGGWDTSDRSPDRHACEERNPSGVGFLTSPRNQREGAPLPNIEDPRHPLSEPGDRPPPAGLGFISPSWLPRKSFAGTFDERWTNERAPLLPDDFDARFFQAAHPDLIAPGHLAGGEPVRLTHLSPRGDLSFSAPRRGLQATLRVRGVETTQVPTLDTLLLDPDDERVICTWKATFPCPRRVLYVERVRVREVS